MIIEMTMYGCKCDNCGKQWEDEDMGFVAFTDDSGIKSYLDEDGEWHTEDDKHYCPECWSYDDEDNLVIKQLTTKDK